MANLSNLLNKVDLYRILKMGKMLYPVLQLRDAIQPRQDIRECK